MRVRNIQLIIASPVRLVREGVAATLRGREGVIVADVVDLGPQGIARISDAKPDVILVDVGETDTATGSTILLLKAASSGAKFVAFGVEEVDNRVFACAAAGFSGYVSRESGADDLHRSLVDAVEGRMHAALFNRLSHLMRESDPCRSLPSLTRRESEILALVEEGSSNKEIARRLAVSSATVKNRMALSLVLWAIGLGPILPFLPK
jgi:two-component system nitrate/nitrite response regulator NarL